jgi:hypothetical protein
VPVGAALLGLVLAAAGAASCARVYVPANDSTIGPGTDAIPNGIDSSLPGLDSSIQPGSDAFVPGTDAAPPGTDAYSGPVWVPPAGDGAACAPEACPASAPQCVGPDDVNAYCRATCNETTVPDPCYPDYDCVALSLGGGACIPAAPRWGCCAACGCGPGDICVSVSGAEPVCLEQCNPMTPTACSPLEACIGLTGMMPGMGGACLPSPAPTCSGVPAMEAMCI